MRSRLVFIGHVWVVIGVVIFVGMGWTLGVGILPLVLPLALVVFIVPGLVIVGIGTVLRARRRAENHTFAVKGERSSVPAGIWVMFAAVAIGLIAFVLRGNHGIGDLGSTDTSDDDTYPPEPPLVLTPAEQAAAEEIFRNIKRASQVSWRTEDWSTFAKLYPEGTFDCWNTPDEPQNYGFLSMRGIPESATYEMHSMGLYMYGAGDTSHMEPTHWMDVSYEHSYPSRCEPPRAARWPGHHFYLRRQDGGFVLEHPCPDRDPTTRRMQVQQPVLSYARARQVVAQMSPAEDRELRQMFSSWPRAGTWSGLPNAEVGGRYRLSVEEADMVLELMCSTTGVPANAPGMSRESD